MIKLQKSKIPDVLEKNGDLWLEQLFAAKSEGDQKKIAYRQSKYNHPDIKRAVRAETNGKCAYCEADVGAVAHGDIEHIYPKSLDDSRTFDWSNLGFACQICNQNKSNKDPISNRIIDPYTIDPAPFVSFIGAFASSNGTTEGTLTIINLDLNRAALIERRNSAFKHLILFLEIIQKSRSPSERQALVSHFTENELGAIHEFSALRRDFWKAYGSALDETDSSSCTLEAY